MYAYPDHLIQRTPDCRIIFQYSSERRALDERNCYAAVDQVPGSSFFGAQADNAVRSGAAVAEGEARKVNSPGMWQAIGGLARRQHQQPT